jgi:hypothetical protein
MRAGASTGVCLAVLCLLGGPARSPSREPSAAEVEFFEKEVRPILVEKCTKCHGDSKPKGGLKLTSRAHLLGGGDSGPAIVAGKPDESLLVRAVRYEDRPRMPPGGKLTDRQIAALTRWVKLGAPWPGPQGMAMTPVRQFAISDNQRRFWSFQPVKQVPPPAVKDTAWPRSPLDRFILAGLERKELAPALPADRRTLIRRATFDLTGLPPTPEEVRAFLEDRSPGAFARVVDRLLASPAYGERWGRHWLDVVRYADARDLIQLPPPSDFREAWRYRDWVVEAFNRDLPYSDFLQYQIAGDLLQPRDKTRLDADALVATGMLAIADFVPGDVDKELMIADYVNDQIDVVGRAFLGLTLACARCHDHKFDPVSTEDYYGLAGIFFSSRLIPGPVPGNTPLVRVPLLSESAIKEATKRFETSQKHRAALEQQLAGTLDREMRAHLKRVLPALTARYLVAACEYTYLVASKMPLSPAEYARREKLDEGVLAGWLAYLAPDGPGQRRHALAVWRKNLREAAAGKLDRPALERVAQKLEQALASRPDQKAPSLLLHLRADDPDLRADDTGQVTRWPDLAPIPADAIPPPRRRGPRKETTKINGRDRRALRFSGTELLEARRRMPPAGSLFVVCRLDPAGNPAQRLIGWEDASVGQHGLGLMPDPAGRLHVIARNNGANGDIVNGHMASAPFEIISVTWGAAGVTLHRDRKPAGTSGGIRAISSDPSIKALRIGGPGSGASPLFRGDVAELRIYDEQLDDSTRASVEAELFARWFTAASNEQAPVDDLAVLYADLVSPRGPFSSKSADRTRLLPAAVRDRLAALRSELDGLKDLRPPTIPEAVVVQDGGPKGTRFEGFRDAHVFVRGDPKNRGKLVPRRFPVILAGDRQPALTGGSGRLQLARWLAGADHPLTARVMVNRIWQHHFGEGLVRTPSNFGERGERPTHPELLDYLASRFVASGWSVKAMHRLIMLSAVYQQSSGIAASKVADPATPPSSSPNPQSAIRNPQSVDPDNRLFGRMNRRRLEAEAIRDSLLAVAGRLDWQRGGPAFADLAVPRRTLYLQSVRTGSDAAGFAPLFDRADPGAIVDRRGVSTVAPQALFFMNDPFVTTAAATLAARMVREAPGGPEPIVRRLYEIVFCRPPRPAELAVGLKLLGMGANVDPLERYCHTLLCTNEFLFVD